MPASSHLALGLSDSHDSGVALIRDGVILAAVNEERLNRRKMASGMPVESLDAIWAMAGVSPSQITAVGVAGTASMGAPPLTNDFTDEQGQAGFSMRLAEMLDRLPVARHLLACRTFTRAYRASMRLRARGRLGQIGQVILAQGVSAPIQGFDHHDCHVASAYYTSGMADSLVISNDGFGDGLSAKVVLGRNGRLRTLSTTSFFHSLGVYYNYVTHICGFPKSHHAGKTTGLAAFGDPSRTLDVFRARLQWDADRGAYRNAGGVFRNCLRDLSTALVGISREDAAAGIQRHCEDILTAMVSHWIETTGERRVSLVGGVHANVKVNQKIAELPSLESLFVFPNMGDGGLALGAAFLAWAAQDDSARPRALEHVYLGPSFSPATLEDALRAAQLPSWQPADLADVVAAHLSADHIVARFDGRMEFGPRALGNRSILYPATRPEVNAWLNHQLHRTEFMPFAPVVREKDAAAFFEGIDARTAHASEFMTLTYAVTPRCRREAPAIVHVDGTARPQVLKRSVNPGYYDILTAYHRRTGLSILVNTSFNMHEEPIVCTPADAITAFRQSRLDVLVLGPFVVTRDGVPPIPST